MPFIDRETELEILKDRFNSSRAEFMVIYGRRRIGKTELVKRIKKTGASEIFKTAGRILRR